MLSSRRLHKLLSPVPEPRFIRMFGQYSRHVGIGQIIGESVAGDEQQISRLNANEPIWASTWGKIPRHWSIRLF